MVEPFFGMLGMRIEGIRAWEGATSCAGPLGIPSLQECLTCLGFPEQAPIGGDLDRPPPISPCPPLNLGTVRLYPSEQEMVNNSVG